MLNWLLDTDALLVTTGATVVRLCYRDSPRIVLTERIKLECSLTMERTGRVGPLAVLGFVRQCLSLRVGGTEYKEHSTQHILGGDNTIPTSRIWNSSANGFMGYGGALTLVNGSPFEWTLSSQTSYQMDTWKWPNLAAGTDNLLIMSIVGY